VAGSGNAKDDSTERLTELLERLFALIQAQSGLRELPFNEGASEEDVRRLEETVGATLPDDYAAFLRRANGQSDWYALTFPPDQLAFLSVDEAIELWSELKEYGDDEALFEDLQDDDKVRSVVQHAGRIPIAYNESGGSYLCLDEIPGPKGRPGQLVFNITEADLVVLEDSVTRLLEQYVSVLESGQATVEKQSPEYGQGYWFTAGGDPIDYDTYRGLAG
jgi:cell wall assembly regulator SMI1